MNDGIDRRTFQAELRSATPEDRKRLLREFRAWVRVASEPQGWTLYLGPAAGVAGMISAVIVIVERAGHSPLFIGAFLLTLAGGLFTLQSNRRAREWRRLHPFEQWRTSR